MHPYGLLTFFRSSRQYLNKYSAGFPGLQKKRNSLKGAEMKRKTWALLFMLGIWLFNGVALYGQQNHIFRAVDYRIELSEDGFHQILMDGYFSYGRPGYPDLPSINYQIAVPPSADLETVQIEYDESGIVSLGSFRIQELPPLATWAYGQRILSPKANAYGNDA